MAALVNCYIPTREFQEGIERNWAQISRQKGNPGNGPREAALLANAVYQNTMNSTSPFVVIGLNQIRKDPDIVRDFGLITGRIPKGRKVENEIQGAVLGEPRWSTLINDLFMIGAINAGKEVHTTHPKIPSEHVWDENRSTFTSFGRELAILKMADYESIGSREFNQVVFQPKCGVQASLTYKDVADRLGKIRTRKDAIHLLFSRENIASSERKEDGKG